MVGDHLSIIHINVTHFAATVAAIQDPSLVDTPFIIAQPRGSRQIVLAASDRAVLEGIYSGMPVATALRMVPALRIVPPDSTAGYKVEAAMHNIATRFSPVVQQDGRGHLYIDVSGTTRLFGPPVDCAVRIRNALQDTLGMKPAIAVAANKLVAKIGTRAIRPSGMAQIPSGEEATFLSTQDIRLLPGVGPSIGRVLSVAGFREIGELAVLDNSEVIALLGKRGLRLRDAARGWDISPVVSGKLENQSIQRRIDFAEPIGEAPQLRSALTAATEDAGLAMRSELMGCTSLSCTIFWADGSITAGTKRSSIALVLDTQITTLGWEALQQAMSRRVRIRSLTITLENLVPAQREPDLFSLESEPSREERLQHVVDATRKRFGPAALSHTAVVLHA
jgi:DNA polymerase-4